MLPKYVSEKLHKQLWKLPTHPIGIVTSQLNRFFRERGFSILNDNASKEFSFIHNPYVNVQSNFDDLLIPPDHPSRSPSDTYYASEGSRAQRIMTTGFRSIEPEQLDPNCILLRSHGTAHQSEVLRRQIDKAVWTVDVFRKVWQ